MTNSWMNEDGEPIMDGAAWRYEQYLDSLYEAEYDVFHENDSDEDECEEDHDCDSCEGPGGIWNKDGVFTPHPGQVWHCSYCSRPCAEGVHDQGEETVAASYNPTTGQWDYTY